MTYGALHPLSARQLKFLFLTFEYMAHLFCALAKPLLKPADKFVILSFCVLQVVVS